MGKPSPTEDDLKALSVTGPSIQAMNMKGAAVDLDAVRSNPSRFSEAVFTVGKAKVRVNSTTTLEQISRKMCHRNGWTLPRTKVGKAYLHSVAQKIMADGYSAVNVAPASDLVKRYEASNRKRVSKERKDRREAAEREMRAAMRKWDFSLEEVTLMWQEREVDAVHEH